jgi:uncharacterized protein YndB with AHSA1/START domain
MNPPGHRRTDHVSRIIDAPPHAVYQALVDRDALQAWLPPNGMRAEINAFEPWAGGAYHVTLYYENDEIAGKTSANADVVRGQFVDIIENERIVQQFAFQSEDPAFAGTMIMTWRLAAVPEGTELTIVCENVPEGIRQEDHEAGMRSTLGNLAAFVERQSDGGPP